jgi:predicted outer membrane repeat protein
VLIGILATLLLTAAAESGVSTVTYQVSAGADDGYAWSATDQDIAAGYLVIGDDRVYAAPFYMSAMRFTNVAIPRSAAIVTAYLRIRSLNDGRRGRVYGIIQGESADHAGDFGSRSIGSAPRTATGVNWDHKFAWDINAWQVSGNIAGVVQEVISRAGYSSGNSIAVFYSTRAESGKSRMLGSFESGYGAVLEITYQTYKISGYVKTADAVAISGAVISAGSGIEGAVTDAGGYYELAVPPGWSGTVTVSKAGWGFSPANRVYSSVAADHTSQDYTAFQPKISGYVRDGAGVGIAGVTVSPDNGGTSDTTDAGGYYEVTVPYVWSGTVTPAKTGWYFSPESWPYSNVVADQTNQNYAGYQPTISGYITDETGASMAGVLVSADGGGWSDTSDASGYYEIVVPYGWSGTVTAAKTGWGFAPAARLYSNVISNQTGQDFDGFQPRISGFVRYSDGGPVEGVAVSANNGGGSDTTDASGYYEIVVAYGWSGTVTAAKTDWGMDPANRVFTNVVADQSNQDFTAFQPTISGRVRDGSGTALADVLVSADGSGSDTTDASGYYEITVPYGWSGTVTADNPQWGFNPSSRSYSNVTSSRHNQDFTAFQPVISGYIREMRDGGVIAMMDVLVTADGGGGSDTTNSSGFYEVTVPYGWSGTVTVSKAEWGFSPPSRSYSNVTANQLNQNCTAFQPKISGRVADAHGTGLEGVALSTDSNGPTGLTDAPGYYVITVPYGWSGTVTPEKNGWGFDPCSREYGNVTADQNDQDYIAFAPPIISGVIHDTNGVAMADVPVVADNNGGSGTTDVNGYYEVTVPYGWSGTVTVAKAFWFFDPPGRLYANVTADASNQDYVGTAAVRISGRVLNVARLGVGGVEVAADDGGGSVTTDVSGFYEVGVPPGWSGVVVPSQPGRTFWPSHRPYTDIAADMTGQHFFALSLSVPPDGAGAIVTIQTAIDAAVEGDTVILEPGIFTGPGNRDIDFRGKAITLRSTDPEDPCIVAATIIDCNYEGEIGLYFHNDEGPNSVLDGVSVTGAWMGIDCWESSPTIRNCIISDCNYGGISAGGSSLLITDCLITGNGNPSGGRDREGSGGILFHYFDAGDSPAVVNCVISYNRSWLGAGINCDEYYGYGSTYDVEIIGCTFIGNVADRDAGAIHGCNGSITNCTFIGNVAGDDGGALTYCWGPISYCTFIGNRAAEAGGALYNCWSSLSNCVLTGNLAGAVGGAYYWGGPYQGGRSYVTYESEYDYNWHRISDCVFVGNCSGLDGGGVYNQHDQLTVSRCTFSGNLAAATGGGIYCGGWLTVENSILWGNRADVSAQIFAQGMDITFSCIQDFHVHGHEDSNNINDNPMFIREPNDGGDGWWDDPCTPDVNEAANNDYGDVHLRAGSPCINAGDPNGPAGYDTVDMDGQPRVMGGCVDMGADEFLMPMITVTSPRAGDVWAAGSWHDVTWDSHVFEGTVDILFSTDGGGGVATIESGIEDTGGYLWELPPSLDSNQCVISVVPGEPDPNAILIDSGLFTIHPDSPGPDVPAGWRSLGGDFDRAGLSDTYGPELGCLKWQFETEGEVAGSVTVGEDDRVHIACEGGKLYTLDVNGVLLWSYDTNSPLLSSPTIGPDGTVYVGSEDGRLFAVDIDGNLRWTHTADAFIYSSPAVSTDGNTVFVGSGDGVLYALGRDGSELWSFETTGFGMSIGAIFASPAIGTDGMVYFSALNDANLYALDPNDGNVKWVCRFERPLEPRFPEAGTVLDWSFASPVVAADGTIYQRLLSEPNLYAIDPNTGSIIWAFDTSGPSCLDPADPACYEYARTGDWAEPVLGPDGTIYALVTGPCGLVFPDEPWHSPEYWIPWRCLAAIDPNGSVKWTTGLGVSGDYTLTVGGDGLIYAAGSEGHSCVVDANGVELGRHQNDNWLLLPVISSQGTLIVLDGNDRVLAIGTDGCDDELLLLHRIEDLDGSGWVNFVDFALLALDWMACTNPEPQSWWEPACDYQGQAIHLVGDINRNLYVDWNDLAALANRWLAPE